MPTPATKKAAAPTIVDEAPAAATEVAPKIHPTDPRADLADVIVYLKEMADDATKIAGVLVHQERDRGRVNRGAFDGGGYAGARTTADDPGLLARLRTLSTACSEFSAIVGRA